MLGKLKTIIAAGALLTTGWLTYPVNSFARGDDFLRGEGHRRYDRYDRHGYNRHNDHHRHVDFGFRLKVIPDGCFRIVFGGSRYYYHEGIYYSRSSRDYVVVAPPSGAVVRSIPYYYEPVMINGVSYYTSDGIYYVYTHRGYKVVSPPVRVIEQVRYDEYDQNNDQPQAKEEDGYFTINISNYKEEYIPVVIKRSGNGFIGPQGEFYAQFPKVEQLKVMYVK